MPLSRPARLLAVSGLALLLVTGGCSGGSADAPPERDTSARLEAARSRLDDAASLKIRLVSDDLPDGTVGLVEADGFGNHDPAFEGVVTIVGAGLGQVDADVVSVKGDVEAKVGFVPRFTPVDPADLGAPDPAALLSADNGVSSWLTQSDQLTVGEDSRDGETILTSISGELPGAVVQQLIPTADETAAFDVVYRLDDDDALRDAAITGPFYPGGADVTYDLTVSASDQSVSIELPSRPDTDTGA